MTTNPHHIDEPATGCVGENTKERRIIMENVEISPFPKPKTYRNKKYLQHIQSKPCLLCAKESIAHHESGVKLSPGSMGKKCSDLLAIPLCPSCHTLRHDQGYITFWLQTMGFCASRGPQVVSGRFIADGIAMREIIKLQMEWIERIP